jgi:hypothetical protein
MDNRIDIWQCIKNVGVGPLIQRFQPLNRRHVNKQETTSRKVGFHLYYFKNQIKGCLMAYYNTFNLVMLLYHVTQMNSLIFDLL